MERRGAACSGWWAVLVMLPSMAGNVWLTPLGPPAVEWPALERWGATVGCGAVTLLSLSGLTRGKTGHAWVLTLFGRYRGSVRRTGLLWINPLALRHRVDVRLRHWRSEPMQVVDAQGTELRVVALVVWRVKDTARALFAVDDYVPYLQEQVEAVTARTVSQLPADSFGEPSADTRTLRDTEAVGNLLSQLLSAECRAVGLEIFSVRPTHLAYAPELATAMRRRQLAAIDAQHRDQVLTSALDAVDHAVRRLTERELVTLDDYERNALVKDLTIAFYAARGSATEPAP
ncbi:SPFH domain-containing protein [Streptomyces flavofungini]|nr:SPFH domain-containing protein [Streptomyces flavofungini]GHC88169.1 hypothetical protein GCM10010349_75230 [Streptomyces flavofungini]